MTRWLQVHEDLKPREASPPQAVLSGYRKFAQDNAPLEPEVDAQVVEATAQISAYRLQDAPGALQAYRSSIDTHPNRLANLTLLREAVKLLIAQRRAAEAARWVEEQWNQVLLAPPGVSSPLLQQYARALTQQGQKPKLVTALETVLSQVPALWDDEAQSRPQRQSGGADAALLLGTGRWGWIYEELVSDLLEAGRVDEALSWAKIRFVTGSFNSGATDRATRMLARVMTVKDPSQKMGGAWLRSQVDPNQPNPLAVVPLPAVFAVADLESLAGASQSARDQVNIRIVQNKPIDAMRAACTALKAKPDSSVAQEQVARVFKALDLNTKRANAFALAYNEKQDTRPGSDPLKAFFGASPPTEATDVFGLAGTLSLPEVDEQATRVPILVARLKSGQLSIEVGLQSGDLKLEDVAYMLNWGGIVDGEGQQKNKELRIALAGFLARQAPQLVAPAASNQGLRLAVTDYYRAQKSPQAEPMLQALLQEAGPFVADQRRAAWEDRPWFVEPTINRLASYYSAMGQNDKAQEVWLALENSTRLVDPIASGTAALEAARLSTAMGKEGEAQKLYERVDSYGYGWATGLARFDRADALFKTHQVEAAQALLLKPLTGQGSEIAQVGLLALLASSYYQTGDAENARRYAQQSLDLFHLGGDKPVRSVQWQAERARQILKHLDLWKQSPVQVESTAISLNYILSEDNKPLVTRFKVTTRDATPLVLSCSSPELKLRVLEATDQNEYRCEREVEVSFTPAATAKRFAFDPVRGIIDIALQSKEKSDLKPDEKEAKVAPSCQVLMRILLSPPTNKPG